MKQAILATVFFASLSAIAQPITLRPGTSVLINGDVISCQDSNPAAVLPSCSIKKGSNNIYQLFVGPDLVEIFYSMNDAVNGAIKLREAQLCK